MRRDSRSLFAALGLAAAVGCNPPSAAPPVSSATSNKTISVVKPERRTVTQQVDQPGVVQAFEETALIAKLPGYVGAIADDPDKKDRLPHDRQIDIGSRVKAGQVLAELSIPELDQEWKQKNALVDQAKAEVVQTEKALAASAANVTLANESVIEAQAGVERARACTSAGSRKSSALPSCWPTASTCGRHLTRPTTSSKRPAPIARRRPRRCLPPKRP